jgi:hypothetical protein
MTTSAGSSSPDHSTLLVMVSARSGFSPAADLSPLADASESGKRDLGGEKPRAGHLVREVPGVAAAEGAPRGTGARTIA